LKKLKQIYEAWVAMTKHSMISKVFSVFIESIFELKVPKRLLEPWQKARRQQQSSKYALCFPIQNSNS